LINLNTPLPKEADVVVVGAGASGLAFAWRLATCLKGLRILIVERGGYVDQRAAPSLTPEWELALQKQFHANPNIRCNDADYPIDDTQSVIKPALFNAIGGSTIRWGAHFPRFRPSDFYPHKLDGVAADWPIGYDDLVAYMDINDQMMGVSGLAGDTANPPRPPRPYPPLASCEGSKRLIQGANQLGWHWWPADAAIATADSANRRACNNCGPCGIGCPRHARASADIAYLAAAQRAGIELVHHAVVTQILMSSGKAKSIQVRNRSGETFTINLAHLVLAGNAISTNVLLNSISEWNNPLLGKGLMLHPTAIVTGYFRDNLKSYSGPFATSIVSQQFCETEKKRGFVRGFQLQALRGQGPLSTALGGYGTSVAWGRSHAKRFSQAFGHSMSLTVTCEDLPEPINRIEVSKEKLDHFGMPVAKMYYRVGSNTESMKKYGIERAQEWLQAAGAEKISINPLSKQAGFHLMGTAPMGVSEKHSVTSSDGRLHGIENITIIDASVFPSSSPVNPTSTLQAIALRAADLMARRLSSQ